MFLTKPYLRQNELGNDRAGESYKSSEAFSSLRVSAFTNEGKTAGRILKFATRSR